MEVASIPDNLLDPPLLRSPLYSADAMVTLAPVLMDAISGAVPMDAWEWHSSPISWIANPKLRDNLNDDPHQYIIADPSGSKRGYAVLGILTTERTYHHELSIIKEVIQGKLREMKILSDYAMKSIFEGMGVRTARFAHDDSYKNGRHLDICSDNWDHMDSKIKQKVQLKEYYIQYINNRQLSEKTIINESQNANETFKNFLSLCTKSRETKFTELKELLLRPFQRLTRYPLLLRELNNRTPAEHPEKQSIQNTIEGMSDIAHEVEEKMDSIKT
ncbi:UNVERIFIED_CONTAM: Intersectin 1 (SH3 domain protein) [Siphonaria sp. JEL0065]|nr:Intersectin 1 (SH3 domain protein) [Siphonaria sp. JEL0065]